MQNYTLERGVKTNGLTGRSTLRKRRSALDCSVIEEGDEKEEDKGGDGGGGGEEEDGDDDGEDDDDDGGEDGEEEKREEDDDGGGEGRGEEEIVTEFSVTIVSPNFNLIYCLHSEGVLFKRQGVCLF
jgi:hypothetical protein